MISRACLLTRCLANSLPIIPSASAHAVKPKLLQTEERQELLKDKISEAVSDPSNRLFAVIYAHKRQFKVSQNDIIHIQHNSMLDVGQKIQLEKVLLVGGRDFTLFGRPLLDPQTVKVYATVVEKSVTSPELAYTKISGKKIKNMVWLSNEFSVLRINDIVVDKALLGR